MITDEVWELAVLVVIEARNLAYVLQIIPARM